MIRNFMRRSTQGVTIILILCWVFGDGFKMWFYYTESEPIQLLACASFQLLTDIIILGQFFVFGDKPELSAEEKSK
jgi:hypothetical protein